MEEKQNKTRTSITIDPVLWDKGKTAAKARDDVKSFSELVEKALKEFLGA